MKDFNEYIKEEIEDNSITSIEDATNSTQEFTETKPEDLKEEETEDLEEEETEDKNESDNDYHTALKCLFQSRDQVHYFHFQTESHSEHITFNDYYDAILDLTDNLIETVQGEFGRIKGKIEISLEDYSSDNIDKHFKETLECIRDCRNNTENGAIKNIYDEIEGLIQKTLYLISLK